MQDHTLVMIEFWSILVMFHMQTAFPVQIQIRLEQVTREMTSEMKINMQVDDHKAKMASWFL